MHRPGTWCRLKIHYCLHLLPAQTKCRLLVGWFFWGPGTEWWDCGGEIRITPPMFWHCGKPSVLGRSLCSIFLWTYFFSFFVKNSPVVFNPIVLLSFINHLCGKEKWGKKLWKQKNPTTTVLPIWVSSIVYFPILSTESPTLLYRVVSGVCTLWENVFSSYIFVLINWRLFQFKLCFKQKVFKPTVDTVLGKQRQWVI